MISILNDMMEEDGGRTNLRGERVDAFLNEDEFGGGTMFSALRDVGNVSDGIGFVLEESFIKGFEEIEGIIHE